VHGTNTIRRNGLLLTAKTFYIGWRWIFSLRSANCQSRISGPSKCWKRGALEIAKRSKQYCSQIFRYAVISERTERDPTVDLKDALKPIKRGHFAAREPDELPDFFNCLSSNRARLLAQTQNAIRLLWLDFIAACEGKITWRQCFQK